MTMAARKLLVTGFGPFPGVPRNPSAAVARLIAADGHWGRLGVETQALVLPTTYVALDSELAPALLQSFDAVLMIGVSGRSRRLRVERRAVNRASTLFPDASGCRSNSLGFGEAVHERRTRASAPRALAALRSAGLPSRLSQDAGRYLCNAAYFRALAEPVPVLFVHIPKARRPDRPRRPDRTETVRLPQIAAALARIAADLLRQGRQGRVEAPIQPESA
jgi:pyroglutamyl-peptidase